MQQNVQKQEQKVLDPTKVFALTRKGSPSVSSVSN